MANDISAAQHFIAGQQLAAAGRHDEAHNAYQAALSVDPRFVPALFALGQSLAAEGDARMGLPLLGQAFDASAGDPRSRAIVAPALAALMEDLVPQVYDPALEQQLLGVLGEEGIDPQPLARFAQALLLRKFPQPAGSLEEAEALVARDPLLTAILSRMIVTEAELERRLTGFRRSLLDRFADGTKMSNDAQRAAVLVGLAALAGEFAWAVSAEEQARIDAGVPPLIGALYRPLGEVATPAEARALKKDRLSGLLVRRGAQERDDERQRHFESLGGDRNDAVSAAVRAQYEESPYPRWNEPPAVRAEPLFDQLGDLPGLDRDALGDGPAKVLVAGAGTGFELVGLALSDPTARFTALDLSRASLAHAQRKAEDAEVAPIRFVQGDILDAGRLGEQFDLIYSTGVLHHMDKPADGLAALVPLLRPGGAIRVGLYSHRARAPINAARELIAKEGWEASPEGIRQFRAHAIAAAPDSPLAELRDSADFNSLSGCRDLVFHVQEHQFDVPGAVALLEGAGLRVAGIEARADVRHQFVRRFGKAADPADLEYWDQLEAEDPSIFASMILLWGQKPAA